ncbi:MAG: ATP-binding protein [Chloroflexota bacterium]
MSAESATSARHAWFSQRHVVLAVLSVASAIAIAGAAYFLLASASGALPSPPGFIAMSPVLALLLVLYWRGWDPARHIAVVTTAVTVGALVPLPQRDYAFLPQSVLLPSALAMALAGPRWVVAAALIVFGLVLVRAGGDASVLGVGHALTLGFAIFCLVAGRLTIDAARTEAERRADQAERARAESEQQALELRRQQESLNFQASLLAAVDQTVIATDAHGRVTYWNRAAEDMFGRPAVAILDQPLCQLQPPLFETPSDGDQWWDTGAPDSPLTTESRALRSDGTVLPVSVSSWPLHDERGATSGRIAVINDITQRQEAERQRDLFQQGEKLRALGQMAGGVAHDLNQVLGVITGYIELAQDDLRAQPGREETRAHLATAAQAASHGGDTVKRLLAFARQRDLESPDSFDAGAVVEEAVRFTAPQWRDRAQADGRPIQVQASAETGLYVRGWAMALREALINLILNAQDALPDGGAIRLTARRHNGQIVIEVADTGVGMPEHVKARVFEPFYSTKGESGTGLGLSMVFGTVERHRGQISVASQEGSGTTFTIQLPAADPPPIVSIPPAAPAPAGPVRILAVEDEPPLAQMLRLGLGRSGHHVDTIASGEAALELLESQPYDLVISDLSLGPGMNGRQLADAVRQRWPQVRFILASGWGAGADEAEVREHAVDALLAKPYRLEDVRRLVGELTSQSG